MFRILVLLLALGSGGVAAWLAWGASPPVAQSAGLAMPEKKPTAQVLVASTDVADGAVLEEAQMRWEPWTLEDVPTVFISRAAHPQAPEAFKGFRVRGGFVSGEPIREDRLIQPGAGFLSGRLPPGKRAIAIRMTAESAAGGFILPNDRVDVIHTAVRPGQSGGDGQVTSRTILTNIRVLAIDQTASKDTKDTAVVGKTATLEVDPDQIAIISAAAATGTISLALRAVADRGETPEAVEAESKSQVVRVFRGSKSTAIEFRSSAVGGS